MDDGWQERFRYLRTRDVYDECVALGKLRQLTQRQIAYECDRFLYLTD
jgi:hypothetical protein